MVPEPPCLFWGYSTPPAQTSLLYLPSIVTCQYSFPFLPGWGGTITVNSDRPTLEKSPYL